MNKMQTLSGMILSLLFISVVPYQGIIIQYTIASYIIIYKLLTALGGTLPDGYGGEDKPQLRLQTDTSIDQDGGTKIGSDLELNPSVADESVQGPSGPDGPAGPKGPAGEPGPQGPPG